jgi:hypothetical protein
VLSSYVDAVVHCAVMGRAMVRMATTKVRRSPKQPDVALRDCHLVCHVPELILVLGLSDRDREKHRVQGDDIS